jgi:hypothetical protein
MCRGDHYKLVLSALVSEASRAQVRDRGVRRAAAVGVAQRAPAKAEHARRSRERVCSGRAVGRCGVALNKFDLLYFGDDWTPG